MDFSEYAAARRPALVRAAVLLGCPRGEAEDLVQTALAKAFRSWRRVERAEQPDAYVYTILLNTWRDTRKRRPDLPLDDLSDLLDQPDHADRTVTGVAVREALARMRPEFREVLVLRYFADLSVDQVCDALRLPPGTVKSRTSRALTALAADQAIVRSR